VLQIGRKIYFDKTTGDRLVDTGERIGNVREMTQEEDFAAYVALSERVPETVGCLQLEYGQYAQDFAECNGYQVNPQTLQLEFSYPDPNIPTPEPVYRKPLSTEVDELKAENEVLRQRVAQNQDDVLFILENMFN